ncbi:DHA2 family efflux MFS transporter permease subunit [Levilactobacillus acidifarinae]|uniref:Major facilitator superfamily permease n=1 Tax=Levilactobacillus acidifarinae DSM 19394 = JCM 15949 TaxID=1423715 RepID=A0A0R1LFZ1_9LACO|nr:DHA2 family efflux MFS transporter permease subunit [Levilactobacillus acidifarinae]KRK94549.1 major facilitator superfamily permease [Levilactobacillus acidifarinae DSM 19394]GEO68298.1 MFS transporter [Levilactobacillus acidifarinae]
MDLTKSIDANGKAYNKTVLVLAIIIGGFMTVLTETLLNNGLANIAQGFHISLATAQWISTANLLTIGVMIPISAVFLYKFDSKKLYLTALGIFLAGTVLAYVAPTFGWLLAGRVVQAVGVGIIMPFMRNIMVLIYPANQRGMAMGITGVVIALAPAIGPTLSGWILATHTWRALFGVLIPVTVAVMVLVVVGMRKLIPTTNPPLDLPSVLYSGFGFAGILYGFSTIGSNWGLSLIVILVGAGLVALLLHRQTKLKDPMLNVTVFRYSTFNLSVVLSSLGQLSLLGMQVLVPVYLQSAFHLSALTTGLLMLPGALLMGVVNPLSGMLFDRYGIRKLAISGFLIAGLATVPFIFFTHSVSLVWVGSAYAVWMVGISLMLMQLATAGINVLPVKLIAHGNAINTMAGQIAGAIATALLISVSGIINAATHSTVLGYQVAFGVLVILLAVGVLASLRFKREPQLTPQTN